MALIIGGESLQCEAHVVDWRAHGHRFTPDMPHIGKRPRKHAEPELLVVHWTGGERPNKSIYRTLKDRGYGVEFSMDFYGHIWQYADPYEVYTAHAGGMNLYSFGIEIQSQGLYPHPLWSKATQRKMDKKWQRGRYRDYVGRRQHSMVCFNAEQIEALLQFCDALAEADIIPRKVPLREDPMILHGEEGDVECGLLSTERVPRKDRKRLTGVCGHFHVGSKLDPGTQPFEELIDHWGLEPKDSSLLALSGGV